MTRYAFLSDVHANIFALEAVLKHIERAKPAVDDIYCLGDLVVYGVKPLETLDRLRDSGILEHCVSGNNDYAIAQGLGADSTLSQLLSSAVEISDEDLKKILGNFDSQWRERRATIMALHHWTLFTLWEKYPDSLPLLQNLRESITMDIDGFTTTLLHASPCEPLGLQGNYLRHLAEAEEAFQCQNNQLTFFGHTHWQNVFQQTDTERPFKNVQRTVPRENERIELDLSDGKKVLINPGSVGQPRDNDPRASYAVFDSSGTVQFFRVEYPIDPMIQAINDLPEKLVDFLKDEADKNFPVTQLIIDRFRNADW